MALMPPFQGGDTGSIPVTRSRIEKGSLWRAFFVWVIGVIRGIGEIQVRGFVGGERNRGDWGSEIRGWRLF